MDSNNNALKVQSAPNVFLFSWNEQNTSYSRSFRNKKINMTRTFETICPITHFRHVNNIPDLNSSVHNIYGAFAFSLSFLKNVYFFQHFLICCLSKLWYDAVSFIQSKFERVDHETVLNRKYLNKNYEKAQKFCNETVDV